MADLRNLSFAELAALLATYGEPSFLANCRWRKFWDKSMPATLY